MIFELISSIDILSIRYVNATLNMLKWMPQYFTNNLSPLDQVMAQAIIWPNVDLDLWRHMASPGHNKLNRIVISILQYIYNFCKFNKQSDSVYMSPSPTSGQMLAYELDMV